MARRRLVEVRPPGFNLGHAGEAACHELATSAGIACTRTDADIHGWDYLWEIESDRLPRPAGLEELRELKGRLSCLVQVKASDALLKTRPRRGTVAEVRGVKLSAAAPLIQTPLPAFFLLLHFDHQPRPQRGFLVHVWGDLLERIGAAIFQRQHADTGSTRSARTLTVHASADDEIDLNSPLSLLDAIQRVATHGREYSSTKAEVLRSMGNPGFILEVDVPRSGDAIAQQRAMAEHVVGLTPSLPATGFRHFRRRFDLTFPESLEGDMGGREPSRLDRSPREPVTCCSETSERDAPSDAPVTSSLHRP